MMIQSGMHGRSINDCRSNDCRSYECRRNNCRSYDFRSNDCRSNETTPNDHLKLDPKTQVDLISFTYTRFNKTNIFEITECKSKRK